MIYVKAGIINVDVIATDGAEECVWGAKGNVGIGTKKEKIYIIL